MGKPAPPISITPKLFRQFAIVTVGLTGLIALFADGEGREAMADEVAAQARHAEQTAAKSRQNMQVGVLRDARKRAGGADDGGFGADEPFGTPSINQGSGGGGGSGGAAPIHAGIPAQPGSGAGPGSARSVAVPLGGGSGQETVQVGGASPRRPSGRKHLPANGRPSKEQEQLIEAASRARSG